MKKSQKTNTQEENPSLNQDQPATRGRNNVKEKQIADTESLPTHGPHDQSSVRWSTVHQDSGWLLIMASCVGDSIWWVERFCRASDMSIHRRIVLLHHGPYGFVHSYGEHIECDTSMLFLPLLLPRLGSVDEASTSVDVEDEGDRPGGNPYDDL
ncbi:hypothetical protein GOP47_0005400 [Adiantum capillus-veneris]|uniref:Uncharacterized protein n=1 Tax=Adiantum capillus-veneris TaxID=13818 RepID=A0A9D4V511_ADICA|nr:hypothetical protein GOP47_0005400 [Adiantum capillus-veneris]